MKAVLLTTHIFLKNFLSALICDKDTMNPSFGKLFFWVVLHSSLRNYADFNEWWLGVIALALTYVFGTKYMPSFLISRFKQIADDVSLSEEDGGVI